MTAFFRSRTATSTILFCIARVIESELQPPCPMRETAQFVDMTDRKLQSGKTATLKSRIHTGIHGGILGGTPIEDPTWYPWMVSLHGFVEKNLYICDGRKYAPDVSILPSADDCMLDDSKSYGRIGHFCGASLINHLWAVTAKHCAQDFKLGKCVQIQNKDNIEGFLMDDPYICGVNNMKNIVAIMGTTSLEGITFEDGENFVHNNEGPLPIEGKGAWYHVVRIEMQYKEEEKNYADLTAGGPKEYGSLVNMLRKSAQDLVLLKLHEYVEFSDTIKPIYLSPQPEEDFDSDNLVISGWGVFEKDNYLDYIMEQAQEQTGVDTSDILRAGHVKKCTTELFGKMKWLEDGPFDHINLNNTEVNERFNILMEEKYDGVYGNKEFYEGMLQVFYEMGSELEVTTPRPDDNDLINNEFYGDIHCVVPEVGIQATSCGGDSGSSLFGYIPSSKNAVLLGLTSIGRSPCNSGSQAFVVKMGNKSDEFIYMLYKRTDTCKTFKWIANTARDGNCESQERGEYKSKCQQYASEDLPGWRNVLAKLGNVKENGKNKPERSIKKDTPNRSPQLPISPRAKSGKHTVELHQRKRGNKPKYLIFGRDEHRQNVKGSNNGMTLKPLSFNIILILDVVVGIIIIVMDLQLRKNRV